MKRNLYVMYAISFFQGMVFYASVATLYRQAAGLLTVLSYGVAALLTLGLAEVRPQAREARPSWRRSLGVLRETLRNRRLLLLAVSFALLGEAVHWVTVFLGQLQYARAGIPVRMIAALFLPATLCELAGVLSDPLTKRIGGRALGAAAFARAVARRAQT